MARSAKLCHRRRRPGWFPFPLVSADSCEDFKLRHYQMGLHV